MLERDNIYKYVCSKGLHLVFFGDDAYIIDTGSPVSFTFNDNNKMDIETLPFELPGNLLGIKKEDMDRLAGRDIKGFIGFDIISRYGITIDKGTASVMFDADADDMYTSFPVRFAGIQGIGLMDMQCLVNGIETKAIFDTGASIGYIHKSLIGDSECTGEISDFGPSFGGEINTEKYKTELLIGDFSTQTEMAKMTMAVELEVGLLGYKAIVGLNDFEWERIVIDPFEERIMFC